MSLLLTLFRLFASNDTAGFFLPPPSPSPPPWPRFSTSFKSPLLAGVLAPSQELRLDGAILVGGSGGGRGGNTGGSEGRGGSMEPAPGAELEFGAALPKPPL